MSTVDVKSLFKSGKKTIKAFKVATGPVVEAVPDKSADETIEQWEAPPVSQSDAVVSSKADLDDYKGQEEQESMKPVVSWKSEKEIEITAKEVVAAPATSAYKPPTQRSMSGNVALPSLSEAVKASTPARTVSATSTSRPKFINAATKKAMEEEEKRKEMEKLEREKEKIARKEQLKAELERQASSKEEAVVPAAATNAIQAASLSEIYAKYINRPKLGRTLA